jgi:two-component sensor histidine kinase
VILNFLKTPDYIQSEETRTKAIDRFCWFIVFQGIFYSALFAYFKLFYVSLLLLFIGASFRYFVFLNKRSSQKVVKTAIVVTTNLGVVAFSSILGFNSGVYLYFFVSPLLVYLIFDLTQKREIYLSLIFYLFNFFLVFLINHYKIISPVEISSWIIETIYFINFVFAFLLCFILVIYFSNSNQVYIAKLKKSSTDKDILLSEIHHRVKNNLAVVSGLMELQTIYVKDPAALDILKDGTRRIKAIGLLHEKLYNGDNYEKVQLPEFMKDLVEYFRLIFPDLSEKVKFEVEVDPIELHVREALPLSLILNELITNSLKYAFKNNALGKIRMVISEDEGGLNVCIEDDGCGFVINNDQKEESLGINLIYSLSEQLGSKAELISNKNGTIYKLHFRPGAE